MHNAGINYWAVLVAGAAYWIFGALWYSTGLFGKTWMQSIGKTKEQIEADFSPMKLVWALVVGLVTAYGIARIMIWGAFGSVTDGIMVGVLTAICFTTTTVGINYIMEHRPMKLFLVNNLYNIIGFIIMGAILGAWR